MSFFGSGSNPFGASANTATTTAAAGRRKDPEIASPPSDTVSCLRFSPVTSYGTSTFLAATSWDNRVRVWEVTTNGTSEPKAEQMHQGPALSACWAADGTKLFSAGADNTAQMWDLASNQFVQVGAHEAPIKTIHLISTTDYTCLMTGGWDKKMKCVVSFTFTIFSCQVNNW